MEKVKAIGSANIAPTHTRRVSKPARGVVTAKRYEMNFGFENLQNSFFYYCFDIENFYETNTATVASHVNVKRWSKCKQRAYELHSHRHNVS